MNINKIETRDLFVFDKNVFFSLKSGNEIVYFKARLVSANALSIYDDFYDSYKCLENEFSFAEMEQIKRGLYYDTIKNKLNEYCNKEVALRVSNEKIKESMNKIIENMTKLAKELENE